jgi:hypothetical protein
MLLNLWYLLAIEQPEWITEPGAANQEFQPCAAAEQIALNRDRWEHPGLGVAPVVDDFLAFIHDAKACGLVAYLIERVLVFPIDPDLAQGNPRDFL